jgi:hypothetical protein
LVHTDPPLYIAERDAAITGINDKIKDLTKDKQTTKIEGLNVLIDLLMDSKHFDKSVSDLMKEYKTKNNKDYEKATNALFGLSDTKDLLNNIETIYTAKPEQNRSVLACS